MVHAGIHKKGYGTELFKFRQKVIFDIDPALKITLGTSQHSYTFFEKMGFSVNHFVEKGYGSAIDRFDMDLRKSADNG